MATLAATIDNIANMSWIGLFYRIRNGQCVYVNW